MEATEFGEVVLPEVCVGVHYGDEDVADASAELCAMDLDNVTGCKGDVGAFACNLALYAGGMEGTSHAQERLFEPRN